MTKRVALYLRVSVADAQTPENQLRQLDETVQRLGWHVVEVFTDHGISGAKGRDRRPAFDRLLKGVTQGRFDLVAAWSVDRLGRSLSDLVAFLNELQAQKVDLFLYQQGLDTSSPSGRMMFQMLGVFAEFERSMIVARVKSGLARARANGTRLGRPPLPPDRIRKIKAALESGKGVRETARLTGAGTASVLRIKAQIAMS